MEFQEKVEREIQARVEFKMNEFLTGFKNTVKHKYGQAFDMTRESNEIWKAFDTLEKMFRKEVHLPTPSNSMDYDRMLKAKDIAVDEIIKIFDLKGSPSYIIKIRRLVSAIEKAQNW